MNNHNEFAKVFYDDKYGQIVVISDSTDDGDPLIRLIFQTSQGDQITHGMVFKDTPAGWASCQMGYDGFNHENAVLMVEKTMKMHKKGMN